MILANVKQYRKVFYEKLKELLAGHDIDLTVMYSDSNKIVALRRDDIDLPPPLGRKVPRVSLFNNYLFLQLPPCSLIYKADLVIIVQATRYLLNYPLLILAAIGMKRVAFWGHGRNHQGDSNSISERIKRKLASVSDSWFAYTMDTCEYLISIGVAPDKITVIENAIDTMGFSNEVFAVTQEDISAMRMRLGIHEGKRVALYCGALYKEKRLPFLMDCAEIIAAAIPDFHLIVIGGGPEADYISRHAESRSYISYLGPLVGLDKAICFRMAELFLMPGAVGLAILDSFAARLPLITTKDALHGPEIAYLAHDVNGLKLPGNSVSYANGVIDLFGDQRRLESLAENAGQSAKRYSVDNMVRNVSDGIVDIFSSAGSRTKR